MALVEYALKACAVLVMLWAFFSIVVILLSSELGVFVLFIGAFTALNAAGSGVALLALGALYRGAAVFSELSGLLWLVVPASLASVLFFDLLLEGLVLRTLKHLSMELSTIWIVEFILGSLFTALSLGIVAYLIPSVELAVGAALAAGLFSAFLRYYLGLWLHDVDLMGYGRVRGEE